MAAAAIACTPVASYFSRVCLATDASTAAAFAPHQVVAVASAGRVETLCLNVGACECADAYTHLDEGPARGWCLMNVVIALRRCCSEAAVEATAIENTLLKLSIFRLGLLLLRRL